MAGDDTVDIHGKQLVDGTGPTGEVAVSQEGMEIGEQDVAAEKELLCGEVDYKASGGVGRGGADQTHFLASEVDEHDVAEGEGRHGVRCPVNNGHSELKRPPSVCSVVRIPPGPDYLDGNDAVCGYRRSRCTLC